MKKHLFPFILLLFLFKKADAQTNVYHPFPDSSALWNETSSWNSGSANVGNPQIEFFGGDTIISTIHYKKIMANGYEFNYSFPNQPCCNYVNHYLGAMRQDTTHKKIYFCMATNTTNATDALLYDFNLQVGDTLSSLINPINTNYVSSIDSILIGTTYRKQFNISLLPVSSNSSFVSLIEGIGSTFGLLYQLEPPFESGSTLNCFSQNHKTLYPSMTDSCSSTVSIKEFKNNSFITLVVYPNPAQNNFTIETNVSDKQNVQVFDVNGKLVLTQTINETTNIDASTLAQGVYNVNVASNMGVVNKRLVIVK